MDTRAQLAAPLSARIKANPGYAPELLALAAVAQLGREARDHLTWLRETYPTATPDGLARLVTRRFVRLARYRGAVVGLAGPLPILADVATLTWNHARVVLHMAAVYGFDPTDRQRASELLVLQGMHVDVVAADAAVVQAQQTGDRNLRRLVAPLSRLAGRSALCLAVTRAAARLLPGGGAVVGALANARRTEWLAIHAARLYQSMESGSTSPYRDR